MNSKNSKISNPHRLLFNLSDKINLKRSIKYVALYKQKYKNINHTKTINLKYQRRLGMKKLSDGSYSLYQIFKIVLSISSKIMK